MPKSKSGDKIALELEEYARELLEIARTLRDHEDEDKKKQERKAPNGKAKVK